MFCVERRAVLASHWKGYIFKHTSGHPRNIPVEKSGSKIYYLQKKKYFSHGFPPKKCFSDVRFSKYRCSRLTTIQALCMSIQKQLDTNRFDSSTNYPLHITSILPFPKPICILSQSECHSANSFAHRGQ